MRKDNDHLLAMAWWVVLNSLGLYYLLSTYFLSELETYEERVSAVHKLVEQIPEPNKRMLELLLEHLEKVAEKCEKNMMTVSNLGVCFGPTLLRNEEETVAAIMDIKFGNVVVEILIENWRKVCRCFFIYWNFEMIILFFLKQILGNDPTNPTPLKRMTSTSSQSGQVQKKSSVSSQLSVLPGTP